MKPEYEKAAEIMKDQQIPGVLAALDATKEGAVASQFGVKGYPTVKYFVNGEFKFDVRVRDAEKIIEFMKVGNKYLNLNNLKLISKNISFIY